MLRTSRRSLAVLGLAGILSLSSCAALNDMASVLANLQRLKFKIAGVRDFRLVGIDLGGKAKLADFNAADVLKLGQAYTAKRLPAELVVDVLAVNPNDGTGGTTRTASTLTGLECPPPAHRRPPDGRGEHRSAGRDPGEGLLGVPDEGDVPVRRQDRRLGRRHGGRPFGEGPERSFEQTAHGVPVEVRLDAEKDIRPDHEAADEGEDPFLSMAFRVAFDPNTADP